MFGGWSKADPARLGARIFSFLIVVAAFPADMWGQAAPPASGAPKGSAAQGANFRATSELQVREAGERPATDTSTSGAANDAVEGEIDRLDPFQKPKPKKRGTVADEAPIPSEPDPEAPRKKEREEPEIKTATVEVERAKALGASSTPRDIVEQSGGGLTEGLTRLSDEGALLGKRWSVNVGAFTSAVYDDNVELTEDGPESDFLFTVGANLAARVGTGEGDFFLAGNYAAGYVYYLETDNESSVDQNLRVNLQYRFTKLTLGLSLGMSYVTGGTVDIGERVRRDTYIGNLSATYAATEKVSVNFTLSGSNLGYKDLLSAQDLLVNAFLDYAFTPKLSLGIGGGYGTTKAEEGSEQTSTQYLLRGSYVATGKLTINGSIGVELRETEAGRETTPIFSFGFGYRLFERTTLTLDTYRRIFASASLAGQNYTATGVTIGVRQQLFPRVGLSLAGGYDFSEYEAADEGVAASREDEFLFFRSALDWEVARWCRMSVFHDYSRSDSKGEGARPFDRNRMGLQVSFMF